MKSASTGYRKEIVVNKFVCSLVMEGMTNAKNHFISSPWNLKCNMRMLQYTLPTA